MRNERPRTVTALNLSLSAASDAPLPAGWRLTAWGTGAQGGTRAIVAVREGTGDHAVAICGTLVSFTLSALRSWLHDFEALVEQRPSAVVAPEELAGLDHLLTMRGQNGQTLPEHLSAVMLPGSTLLVTGHSLGGSLAGAFSTWIAGRLPGVAVCAHAFDAPAPVSHVLATVL